MTRPPNCKNVHFLPKRLALLTNDLAEATACDLRKSEKNDFEIRRSAKRRVDLSRKPGFWIDHREQHRFTVRHPACDSVPLTSDPGCRTAVPTGKENHNGPENDGRDRGAPASVLWVGATLIAAGASPAAGTAALRIALSTPHPRRFRPRARTAGPGATVTTEESDLPPVTSVPSSSSRRCWIQPPSDARAARDPARCATRPGRAQGEVETWRARRLTKPARPATTGRLRPRRPSRSAPEPGSGPACRPDDVAVAVVELGNGSDAPSRPRAPAPSAFAARA